uniref:Putative maxadilan related protein n=1 Tax=Nyssomyia neivai TaxID=330878 RepID=A0A1L8DPS7_9DIPT
MRIGLILLFIAVVLVFSEAVPCPEGETQLGQPCEHSIAKRGLLDFAQKFKEKASGIIEKAKESLKKLFNKTEKEQADQANQANQAVANAPDTPTPVAK